LGAFNPEFSWLMSDRRSRARRVRKPPTDVIAPEAPRSSQRWTEALAASRWPERTPEMRVDPRRVPWRAVPSVARGNFRPSTAAGGRFWPGASSRRRSAQAASMPVTSVWGGAYRAAQAIAPSAGTKVRNTIRQVSRLVLASHRSNRRNCRALRRPAGRERSQGK
jgi:hypothetical protein